MKQFSTLFHSLLFLLLLPLAGLGQNWTEKEDYRFSGDWEHILQIPEYNGNLLTSYGGVLIQDGAVKFENAGCRSDKRVCRTLGFTLGNSWDAAVDFTPTGGGPHGTGAVIMAITAGLQDAYKIVPEVVTTPYPSFAETDQDGVLVEYLSPNYGAYSTYYVRLSVKVGTTRYIGSTHLLAPNTGTYRLKLSRLSDRFRLQIVQGGSVQGTLEILNNTLTAGLPQGLHAVQHGVNPQGGYNRRLTATVDNLTIYDANQPFQWCGGIDVRSTVDTSRNRIVSETMRQPVQLENDIDNTLSTGGDRVVQIGYFDALGRPDQMIDIQAAPNCGDIVSYHQYDDLSREPVVDLPYVDPVSTAFYRSNSGGIPQTTQRNFYATEYAHLGSAEYPYPYSVTQFEASPLNRVVEQGAPGATWQPESFTPGIQTASEHTIISDYDINTTMFRAISIPDASVTLGSLSISYVDYDPGELTITLQTDENENLTEVATDKMGRTIYSASYLSPTEKAYTVYFYDEKGRLWMVVQPEGYKAYEADNFGAAGWTEMYNYHVFEYRYDARNRVASKRVPSGEAGGWTDIVFDRRDRPVMTQDPAQASRNEWSFTKYDALDRPILTGLYTTSQDRAALQAVFEGATAIFESRTGASYATQMGYTDQTFPSVSSAIIHSVTYYDGYDFNQNGNPNDEYSFAQDPAYFPDNDAFTRVRGQVTGVKVRVLDPEPDMPTWLITVTYYDDRGREIQTQADNHLGGRDTTDYAYNFAGELLMSRHSHAGHDGTGSYGAYERNLRTWRYYHYDQRGRLTRTEIRSEDPTQVNASTGRVTLANQDYDALGQLQTKKLHNDGSGTFWQSVDFTYNIRGWLTTINDLPSNSSQSPSSLDGDLFSLKLYYDDVTGLSGASAQYNGNISAGYWWSETKALERTAGSDEYVKGFQYDYDALNRLTTSTYSHNNAFGSTYTYDHNGNLETLDRNIPHQSLNDQVVKMDDLSYTYQGNRLLSVSDASSFNGSGIAQFEEGTNSGNDYTYDASGNLIGDQNQGITLIYNHLNKPTEIQFATGSKLTYIYSADGTKLRQIQQDAGDCLRKQTDYVGPLVYEDPDGIGTGASCSGGGSQEIDSSDVYLHALKTAMELLPVLSVDSLKATPKPIFPMALHLIQRGLSHMKELLTTNEPFALSYMMHEEGRIRRSGTELVFEYYLRDHLGNTRVMFGDNDDDGIAEALQEDHYYPFGLQLADGGIQAAAPTVNLYNRKELQDELGLGWYDYGARMLNPTIGRWNGVDELSWDYRGWTPYNYTMGNPIRFIDPDGRDVKNAHEGELAASVTNLVAKIRALNSTMNRYGLLPGQKIKKKDFLKSGNSKSDWKQYAAARDDAKGALKNYKRTSANFHNAQEDINALQAENPQLFNALNTFTLLGKPVDVFIGRTKSSEIGDTGGAGNEFHFEPGKIVTYVDIDNPVSSREGISIWLTGTSMKKLRHEVGHVLSYSKGLPSLGVNPIPYMTQGNPYDINDYWHSYQHWMKECGECRENGVCNPTSSAAVAAERLPTVTRYARQNSPYEKYIKGISQLYFQ